MRTISISEETSRRRRNTRADQLCIYRRTLDGAAIPVVAIGYKAPHKLTREEVSVGLGLDIWPERDVIDKNEEDFTHLCRYLMVAVVTQLFSYVIDKGIKLGCVCTGEAFVFMQIPTDPTRVYCSVNITNRDYQADDECQLEHIAVAQVFAFIMQALADDPPDQSWRDATARNLKLWKVEHLDVLYRIPETKRTTRDGPLYEPSVWTSGPRDSPIARRSQCRPRRSRKKVGRRHR